MIWQTIEFFIILITSLVLEGVGVMWMVEFRRETGGEISIAGFILIVVGAMLMATLTTFTNVYLPWVVHP